MNNLNITSKKGVSPVIATVLLIAMVVVMGLIVFLWFRNFSEEAITKFDDKNVKIICEQDISFEARYSDGELVISNLGNVPIYNMKVKKTSAGSYTTINLNALSSKWPSSGLNEGEVFSDTISFSEDKITLIPTLMGKTDKGNQKTYTCDEKDGKDIILN